MKKFFVFLLGFLSLALATTTAFFSVYGISKLFMGKALAVIILFGLLEAAKIVLVSVYHQFFEHFKGGFKFIIIAFVVVLMAVTSVGVYGFLTSAYSSTSVELQKVDGQVQIYDKKIEIKKEEKSFLSEQIDLKNKRISSLGDLRRGQETRLDSLYQRGHYRSAKQTESIIKEANDDIKNISIEIDSLNFNIQSLNDSISFYESKKLEINSGDLSGEVGPLKFISSITGLPMDNVVNILMLIFMFLADPGAVLLVVLTNRIIRIIKKENEVKKTEFLLKDKKNEVTSNEIKETDNLIADNITKKDESVVLDASDKNIPQEVSTSDIEDIKEEPQDNNIVEYVSDDSGEFIKTDNKHEEKTTIKVDKNTIIPGVFTAYTESNETNNSEEIKISTELNSNNYISENTVNHTNNKSEYLLLLKKFYLKDDKGVLKKGDKIPTFVEFKKVLELDGVVVKEKVLNDFLVICGLLNITLFDNINGVFNKEYEEAYALISQI